MNSTGLCEPAFLSDPDLLESPVLGRLFDIFGVRLNASILARLSRRMEGGELRSRTLRRLLWRRYNVCAKVFSYGAFHEPGACEPGITIERFASVSRDVRWGLGHPMNHVSLSHFFANPSNGFTDHWPFERPTLTIGADAWIGAQVVITSGCSSIGIGAVIGAGSIVTRNVPDFAVVYGTPARVIRYRFPESIQRAILESRWWEHRLGELKEIRRAFTQTVDDADTLAALEQLKKLPELQSQAD